MLGSNSAAGAARAEKYFLPAYHFPMPKRIALHCRRDQSTLKRLTNSPVRLLRARVDLEIMMVKGYFLLPQNCSTITAWKWASQFD